MSRFSIVIPSRNLSNLTVCVGKLREMGETARVKIVWDGADDIPADPSFPNNAYWRPGVKPFVFARNVNIGIISIGHDVVVMNDDALLETPRGLTLLSECAAANPDYGVIAASVDACGTMAQIHGDNRSGLRQVSPMVAFICVYIPRKTVETIGYLDERFGVNAGGPGKRGYGLEDDDYCWRCEKAGLKIGVLNDVLVSHTKLPSTFRHDKEHPADVKIHEALFQQKWGCHPRLPQRRGW